MVLAIRPVVVLLFAVVVMMMIGLLLLLFLVTNRVVGCRRHPPRRSLLLSPISIPVVGLRLDPLHVLLHVAVRLRLLTMSKLLLLLLLLTISHLTHNIPTVLGHQVFLVVDTVSRPLISLRRVWVVPAPEKKVSNATMAVAILGLASGSALGRQVPMSVSFW